VRVNSSKKENPPEQSSIRRQAPAVWQSRSPPQADHALNYQLPVTPESRDCGKAYQLLALNSVKGRGSHGVKPRRGHAALCGALRLPGTWAKPLRPQPSTTCHAKGRRGDRRRIRSLELLINDLDLLVEQPGL
jgi:hypothetical protein